MVDPAGRAARAPRRAPDRGPPPPRRRCRRHRRGRRGRRPHLERLEGVVTEAPRPRRAGELGDRGVRQCPARCAERAQDLEGQVVVGHEVHELATAVARSRDEHRECGAGDADELVGAGRVGPLERGADASGRTIVAQRRGRREGRGRLVRREPTAHAGPRSGPEREVLVGELTGRIDRSTLARARDSPAQPPRKGTGRWRCGPVRTSCDGGSAMMAPCARAPSHAGDAAEDGAARATAPTPSPSRSCAGSSSCWTSTRSSARWTSTPSSSASTSTRSSRTWTSTRSSIASTSMQSRRGIDIDASSPGST